MNSPDSVWAPTINACIQRLVSRLQDQKRCAEDAQSSVSRSPRDRREIDKNRRRVQIVTGSEKLLGAGAMAPRPHQRSVGWVGTTALAMGGSNQSLFYLAVEAAPRGLPQAA
jgi:hypothetical protein